MKRTRSRELVRAARLSRSTLVMALFLMATVAVSGASLYQHYASHAAGGWLSGASGSGAANGTFGTWRGEPVTIVGSWSDTQSCQPTACTVGDFDNYSGAMDFAMGGIYEGAGETWANAGSGAYDSRFQGAINTIKSHRAGKGTTYVRFAHEFNLGYSDWAVMPGDESGYIATFRKVADMLHAAGLKVTWSPNDGTQSGAVNPTTIWPGDQYVDVVGVDSYDWGVDPSSGSVSNPDGVEMWRQLAASHGKPLAFPEWGANNESAKDNPSFITQRYNFMSSNAGSGSGQFIYDVYFNFTNSSYSIGLYPNTNVPNMADTYKSLNWGNGGLSTGGGSNPTPSVPVGSNPTPYPTPYPTPSLPTSSNPTPYPTPVTYAPPVIQTFTANPATVAVGGRSILSWSTSGTVACSVNPGGPQISATTSWQTPNLNDQTVITYTLDCMNNSGVRTSKAVTVTVGAPSGPPSKPIFVASSTIVKSGTRVMLSWYAPGATSCTVTPANISAVGAAGSYQTPAIMATTTYNLSCSNSKGAVTASPVTIGLGTAGGSSSGPGGVVSSSPAIVSFFADPANIPSGFTSTLYWTTTGIPASGCNLSPSPLSNAGANGSWMTPYLLGSKTYTLTCVGADANVVTKSVSVTVNGITAPGGTSTTPAVNTADNSQGILTASNGDSITNAAVNTTVSGWVTLEPSNITNISKQQTISRTEYYENNVLLQTDSTAPFALDSTKLTNGSHNITERTYFSDGSRSEVTRLITVQNTAAVAKTSGTSAAAAGLVITIVFLLAVGGGVAFLVTRNRVTVSSLREKYGNSIDTSLIK